jgi:UDP-N-acetylmuramoyl-L-alanyl-D-glutamate--2,6-diaminopimelate ligase
MPFLTELLGDYHDALSIEGDAERLPIASVTGDSRQVTPGALFVAVKGNQADGTAYAMDAIAKGAVAVVTDNDAKLVLPASIALIRVDNTRKALAKFAGAFYVPQPSFIAAVTGTDGKTSTADFFRQLWQMSYQKAASIGTLGVLGSINAAHYPALNTTPDPVQMHQTLQALAKEQCQYVALEASSHGLDQYRLDGVKIMAAAFTNLTRDHLDYHHTVEGYFQAKLRLFTEVLGNNGTAVLNADDAKFRRLSDACTLRNIRIISYGQRGQEYRVKKITPTIDGLAVQLDILGKSHHFMLHMVGEFQVMNALSALGLYVGCGGSLEEGLKHVPHLHSVPGRVEKVANHPSGAAIFVDYAHTPAALANVLRTMRLHVKGKLTVVFGCGGDRDKGKRPEMGKAATEFADNVIITDDNPRSENPSSIRADVQLGAPGAQNIADRAEAIALAIKSLQSGDVLLIAGKGHEKTQTIGNKIIPFDDAEVARYAVKLCEKRTG